MLQAARMLQAPRRLLAIPRAPTMAQMAAQPDSRLEVVLSAARAARAARAKPARTKPVQQAAAGALDSEFGSASPQSRTLQMDRHSREAERFGAGLDPRLDRVGRSAAPRSRAWIQVFELAADWS